MIAPSKNYVIHPCRKDTYDWTANPGLGTSEDPYRIDSTGQFESLTYHSDLWDKHCILQQDIDLGHRIFADSPLARDPNKAVTEFQGVPFSGGFDGNEFCIRNLSIITGNWSIYTGLFGYVDASAAIRNLALENMFIYGKDHSYFMGGLAGYNLGEIHNCHTEGILCTDMFSRLTGALVGANKGDVTQCSSGSLLLSGHDSQNIGGLIGNNSGSVTASQSQCRVWGGKQQGEVGGLVGSNIGDVVRAAAYGVLAVGEGSEGVGGLVGNSQTFHRRMWNRYVRIGQVLFDRDIPAIENSEAQISQAHALCEIVCVRCCRDVGGLAGMGTRIFNSYAGSHLVATCPEANIGGFIGHANSTLQYNYSTTYIDIDYAAEPCRRGHQGICPEVLAGGFAGDADPDSGIVDCYFLAPSSGDASDNGIAIALTDEQMRLQERFAGWDFLNETDNGTQDIWFMPAGGYPIHAWED